MRHDETVAVTITIPKALHRAVQELADRDHCGNFSAAIRKVLYKEAGVPTEISLSPQAVEKIQHSESRATAFGRPPRLPSSPITESPLVNLTGDPGALNRAMTEAHPLRAEASLPTPKVASPIGSKSEPRTRVSRRPKAPPSVPIPAPK